MNLPGRKLSFIMSKCLFLLLLMLLTPCLFPSLSTPSGVLHVSLAAICWFVPLLFHVLIPVLTKAPVGGSTAPRGPPQLDQRERTPLHTDVEDEGRLNALSKKK
ncbi:MAG: hypothetical protein J3Q66DRAFT_344594 [Benniella sp.]|nr:MAG: hypothetical protein J3Q66DRAFT_344594 [Benniella sp.]